MNYFIKIEEGEAVGYPLVESNIRYLFNGLPKGYISNDLISGYAQYIKTDKPPTIDFTKEYIEGTAIVNGDGVYVQTWVAQDAVFDTQEEESGAVDATRWGRLHNIRITRDAFLSSTDLYALQDVNMTDAMLLYRQELRDLPATYADNPEDVVFPTKPTGEE